MLTYCHPNLEWLLVYVYRDYGNVQVQEGYVHLNQSTWLSWSIWTFNLFVLGKSKSNLQKFNICKRNMVHDLVQGIFHEMRRTHSDVCLHLTVSAVPANGTADNVSQPHRMSIWRLGAVIPFQACHTCVHSLWILFEIGNIRSLELYF